MKSHTPEGRQLLMDHNNLKENLVEGLKSDPKELANQIEKLTFITLRRFRALSQWPYYNVDEEENW